MKNKNFPTDNDAQTLEELTEKVNNITETLEKEKDLRNSVGKYQELLRLNNIIEKKFKIDSKIIAEKTKKKISNITKRKYAKKN